jgi:hypothetical protein
MQTETGTQTEVVLHSDRGGFAHVDRGGFAHSSRWICTQTEVVLHMDRGGFGFARIPRPY